MQEQIGATALDFHLVEVRRQLTAVVRVTTAMADIPAAERSARASLAGVLPSLGLTQGRAFTRWSPPVDGILAMEIGVIVDGQFEAADAVVSSELPAGRAAYHLLRGPFEGLGAAWGRLLGWCQEQGLKCAGTNWQVYGPDSPDPQQQETELYALLSEV